MKLLNFMAQFRIDKWLNQPDAVMFMHQIKIDTLHHTILPWLFTDMSEHVEVVYFNNILNLIILRFNSWKIQWRVLNLDWDRPLFVVIFVEYFCRNFRPCSDSSQSWSKSPNIYCYRCQLHQLFPLFSVYPNFWYRKQKSRRAPILEITGKCTGCPKKNDT